MFIPSQISIDISDLSLFFICLYHASGIFVFSNDIVNGMESISPGAIEAAVSCLPSAIAIPFIFTLNAI